MKAAAGAGVAGAGGAQLPAGRTFMPPALAEQYSHIIDHDVQVRFLGRLGVCCAAELALTAKPTSRPLRVTAACSWTSWGSRSHNPPRSWAT